MKSTLSWAVVWLAILGAGYWVSQHLLAPPRVSVNAAGGEILIPVSSNGHYLVEGAINGVPLRFLVDTGATYVAVDAAFASRAQLPPGVVGYFNTANGTVQGRLVKGQAVRVESFEVTGLTVAVMPDAPGDGLLGQNFLSKFDVSFSGGMLRLRPRAE